MEYNRNTELAKSFEKFHEELFKALDEYTAAGKEYRESIEQFGAQKLISKNKQAFSKACDQVDPAIQLKMMEAHLNVYIPLKFIKKYYEQNKDMLEMICNSLQEK